MDLCILQCMKCLCQYTIEEPISIHTASTVVIQREDGRPWMNGSITEHGNEDYNGKSYKKWTIKCGQKVTRSERHIKHTPITVE